MYVLVGTASSARCTDIHAIPQGQMQIPISRRRRRAVRSQVVSQFIPIAQETQIFDKGETAMLRSLTEKPVRPAWSARLPRHYPHTIIAVVPAPWCLPFPPRHL